MTKPSEGPATSRRPLQERASGSGLSRISEAPSDTSDKQGRAIRTRPVSPPTRRSPFPDVVLCAEHDAESAASRVSSNACTVHTDTDQQQIDRVWSNGDIGHALSIKRQCQLLKAWVATVQFLALRP